jgi:hypothetical protein
VTVRLSNSEYLTVLPPRSLDGVGWTVRVLSERDYSSPVALVERFAGLGFTMEANGEGGGTVSLDSDDGVFAGALPAGETTRLQDQEALWQVMEDGQVRFEFLAEDVDEDVIPDGGGPRQTVIAGRGTASVLEWAPVLPAGMPTPSSMSRTFNAHPMTVWAQLFAEAQAAGFLTWVNLSFDGSIDSQAVPWGGPQALTVSAGDTLLDLLKRWAEANELSWRMLPGFILEVRQDGGNHLENTVVFTQYRSQGEHKRKITRRQLANIVYADSGDNGLAYAEDSASAAKWRKRAAWVSAGDSGDASARSAVANISLSLSKDQRQSRTIKLIPDREGRQPFVDFGLHDWVRVEVPDDDAESGSVRVMGLAVDIDAAGVVQYEATLQSRFEGRALKTARLLDKLGGSERSGSGGAASSPIPVSKALSVVKLADLTDVDLTAPATGSLLQWNGALWVDVVGNLDLLADVDTGTIPGTGEVSLILDRPTGLWKPTVSAAAGGVAVVPAKHLFPVPIITTAAGSTTVGKGQRVMALANVKVTAFSMWITGVAGKTYRLACWELGSTGLVIAAQIGAFVDVASPGTGKQKISSGAVAWNLDAGKHYAFTLHASDSSVVAAYTAGTTAAGSPGLFLTVPPAQNGCLTFAAAPALTVAGTSAVGQYETEIVAETR